MHGKKSYAYDPLYRLTDETVTQGTAPGSPIRWKNGFTYDPVGNRQRQDRTEITGSSRVVTYGYDERDRLTSETSGGAINYGWDENGNQVSKGGLDGAAYTWDFEDRLSRVVLANGTTVDHVYDVDGTRVRTTTTPAGGTALVVDYLVDPEQRTAAAGRGLVLSQVVAESDASWNVIAYHVRGDELLATLRPNTAPPGSGVEPWMPRYVHADGLGSVRALTDEQGNVTDRWDFEAFGALISHQGSDPTTHLFAGEALDPSSGFYYNRARWMQPESGRFLATDPYVGTVRIPMSRHRYLYAALDPVLLRDPTGRFVGGMAELNVVTAIRGLVSEIQSTLGFNLIEGASNGGNVSLASLLYSAAPMVLMVGGKAVRVVGRTHRSIGLANQAFREFRDLGVSRVFVSRATKRLTPSALAKIWKIEDMARGWAIQAHLSATEYRSWYEVGEEANGFFPLVDFQSGRRLGSLKTTRVMNYGELTSHIDDLVLGEPRVGGRLARLHLDIRIPPWRSVSDFASVVEYGAGSGVDVIVRNFP